MYGYIVVGTDCSATAERAVERAAELASAVGATLHIVSAWMEPAGVLIATGVGHIDGLPQGWQDAAIADRQARLDATAARLTANGIHTETRVVHADTATTLVSVAQEVGADLIVVGDRGLKSLRRLLGSVL